jgi:2-polyprenyl-3-methyl-5-hydroxy-6-metoxy-1,4-benzoquinol methylase
VFINATEITSAEITSDNPIHQRLLFAYEAAQNYIQGDLLEIGCGEGRGVELLVQRAASYTAIDKIATVVDKLKQKYPSVQLLNMFVPPFTGINNNTYDRIVTFQVIEHIEDDDFFVKEIHRVLKPGGLAIITTPNIKMSLTRNPWHMREYTKEELNNLLGKYFARVEMLGVYGSGKVNEYYERNKESVQKFKRLDIFNLEQRLPRKVLQFPYNLLNRINRNRLEKTNDRLVMDINTGDYSLQPADDSCYDFFALCYK